MPRRVGRPCAQPGCPAVVLRGAYCAEHQRPREGGPERGGRSRLSPSRRGYDRHWQQLRRLILSRQPLCVECERAGRIVAATEVDHIVPLAVGGTNDTDNLQPLCKSCHSRKTLRQQRGEGE